MDQKTEAIAAVIRENLSIFDVLEKVGIALPQGTHTQQIPCPFHDDRSPSARVYGDSNKIYCFTCHKLWDVFSLIEDLKETSFEQSVWWIAKQFDIKDVDVATVIKSRITRPKTPDHKHIVAMSEEFLKTHKKIFGFRITLTYFMAVDTAVLKYESGESDFDDLKGSLRAILAHAGKKFSDLTTTAG